MSARAAGWWLRARSYVAAKWLAVADATIQRH